MRQENGTALPVLQGGKKYLVMVTQTKKVLYTNEVG